jgi:hypothetical protein
MHPVHKMAVAAHNENTLFVHTYCTEYTYYSLFVSYVRRKTVGYQADGDCIMDERKSEGLTRENDVSRTYRRHDAHE